MTNVSRRDIRRGATNSVMPGGTGVAPGRSTGRCPYFRCQSTGADAAFGQQRHLLLQQCYASTGVRTKMGIVLVVFFWYSA
jgi:hypothetical protein